MSTEVRQSWNPRACHSQGHVLGPCPLPLAQRHLSVWKRAFQRDWYPQVIPQFPNGISSNDQKHVLENKSRNVWPICFSNIFSRFFRSSIDARFQRTMIECGTLVWLMMRVYSIDPLTIESIMARTSLQICDLPAFGCPSWLLYAITIANGNVLPFAMENSLGY